MENVNHKEVYADIVSALEKNGLKIYLNKQLANDIIRVVDKYKEGKDLEVTKAVLFTQESLKKGAKCPCCNQNVKMYWKKIDSQMAYYLIKMYRLTSNNPQKDFFHVEDDLEVPLKVGGSWAKLRWWGLIEELPKDKKDTVKRTSGMWKITELGKNFAQNRISVSQYVKLYNGGFHGTDGKDITIKDALTDKFNYVELMNTSL